MHHLRIDWHPKTCDQPQNRFLWGCESTVHVHDYMSTIYTFIYEEQSQVGLYTCSQEGKDLTGEEGKEQGKIEQLMSLM